MISLDEQLMIIYITESHMDNIFLLYEGSIYSRMTDTSSHMNFFSFNDLQCCINSTHYVEGEITE